MVLNITEKPEVAEKFIYFVFFKTKEKRFLVGHFKNTLETLFCTTEESEFVREEIQVTLKNYCWLFLWILAEESHNRRAYQAAPSCVCHMFIVHIELVTGPIHLPLKDGPSVKCV